MTEELLAIWDEICRRNLGRGLDDCPPAMVRADDVVEGLFSIVMSLGTKEGSTPAGRDKLTNTVAEAFWKSAAATGSIGALVMLSVEARNRVRELAKYVLIMVQNMAHSGVEYGPVPSGLSGQALGYASLSLEILQQKSPQRLIEQQVRQAH